jgi:thiamine biosynthesis protein ThiS
MSEINTIRCTINDQEYSFPAGTTLLDFLNGKNIPPGAVIVEMNKRVLPKGQYEGIVLSDGDALEVLQVIGGG